MACSIVSEKVKMHLETTQTDFSLSLGHRAANTAETAGWRSALQNPELSRLRLDSILRRRNETPAAEGRGKSYWEGFLARCSAQNANGNATSAKEIS